MSGLPATGRAPGGRRRTHGPATAVIIGLLALFLMSPQAAGPSGPVLSDVPTAAFRTAAPVTVPVVADPLPDPEPEVLAEPEPGPPPAIDGWDAFAARYPAQVQAVQTPDPAGSSWALLIGINEHRDGVSNNIGSRQDAQLLRQLLLDAGWRDDHIVLITDGDATGNMIRQGLAWLAWKTTEQSTAVFHYSGHSKKWYGPGGRIDDIALWPTNGDFVRRAALAESLGKVQAGTMWLNFATCNAAALKADSFAGQGRLLTFSSAAPEKSYEDPAVNLSVWGNHFLALGLHGHGLHTSIQEAYAFAAPRAETQTSLQVPYGPQRPVLIDNLGEPFVLTRG